MLKYYDPYRYIEYDPYQLLSMSLERIKLRISNNIDRIRNYHIDNDIVTDVSYKLITLIKNVDSDSEELGEYIRIASQRMEYICKKIGLYTTFNLGEPHDSNFTSPLYKEYIFVHDSVSYSSDINWKDIESVKFMDHPFSNVMTPLPDGNWIPSSNQENDYVFLTIDFRALCIQYFNYKKHNVKNIELFISKHVLPNMLYSYTNIAIMNILKRKFSKTDIDEDYHNYVIKILPYRGIYRLLSKRRFSNMDTSTYDETIRIIPAIHPKDMRFAIHHPDVYNSENVKTLKLLSTLNTIEMILSISKQPIKNNKLTANYRKDLEELINSKRLDGFTNDNAIDFEPSINRMLELLDKK